MGWVFKVGLLLLMLLAISFSAWMIVLPIGAYFVFITVHGGEPHHSRKGASNEAHGPGVLARIQKDKVAGSTMLLLAMVAVAQGGTFSVALFLGVAILSFFHRPLSRSRTFSWVEPVERSILLRRRAVPFRWLAVAEVKPARGRLATLLATVDERFVVRLGERPSIHVVLEESSLSRRGAESSMTARLRRVSRTLAPLGAYVLPLDSVQACESFRTRLEREDVETDGLPTSLEASPFNMLVIQAKGGFVTAFGAYMAEEDEGAPTSIPTATQHPSSSLLLVEALGELEKRTSLPQPDPKTSFLASLYSAGRAA